MSTQPVPKALVGRSLPPGGMVDFLAWLTWLPRVPRLWCKALGGGSRLHFGLGTWPGQVQSGMQQTEGETSVMWTPEPAGSSSPET